jgi:hypothetical protein
VTLQHLRFVVMNFADLFPLVYDGSLNLDVVMRIWPNLSDSDDSQSFEFCVMDLYWWI